MLWLKQNIQNMSIKLVRRSIVREVRKNSMAVKSSNINLQNRKLTKITLTDNLQTASKIKCFHKQRKDRAMIKRGTMKVRLYYASLQKTQAKHRADSNRKILIFYAKESDSTSKSIQLRSIKRPLKCTRQAKFWGAGARAM